MTDKADTPPDHLSIHAYSKAYNGDALERGIGIRFKGNVRTNVEEYCISEGWIKVQAGKSLDRNDDYYVKSSNVTLHCFANS
jgi:Protein of unknown function (DUF3297)